MIEQFSTWISDPYLCALDDEEISSSFGSNNFAVQLLTDSDVRSGTDMLSGSLTYNIISPTEYMLLHSFEMTDGSVGSVELLGLNFTSNTAVTALFYIINLHDDSLYANGVS